MKVFLSWSGPRSKAVAEAFAWWLPQVIQAIDPWISSDIEKGTRWSPEISSQLETTKVGIICLTADNLGAPWLLFESGALSKTKEAYVCTFLLDVTPAEVEQPLGQFQHTVFTNKDVSQLVHTINGAVGTSGDRALGPDQLRDTFEMQWPRLESRLKEISPTTGSTNVKRDDRALLEEILEGIRLLQRNADAPSQSSMGSGSRTPSYVLSMQISPDDDWSEDRIRVAATAAYRAMPGVEDMTVTKTEDSLVFTIYGSRIAQPDLIRHFRSALAKEGFTPPKHIKVNMA